MAALFDDFASLVVSRRPLIDVRAPVEFAKGAFPGAVNLPLMTDEERRLVGIRYKERGNAEAVKLGHELVCGETKARRVAAWCRFVESRPEALLYCFRGGQRSQIAQRWMAEAGCEIPRLKGGYKALRRFLIDETAASVERFAPLVLGGRTGSGKTALLKSFPNAIDLEGLANHRGSSFGRRITPQPTQIDFENALAYELIGSVHRGFGTLLFEDEGRNVGRLYLPDPLVRHLDAAPLVILETPMRERVRITWQEYVEEAQRAYAESGYREPLREWKEAVASAMARIERRLGGYRYAIVRNMLDEAYEKQRESGDMQAHMGWVEYLLREYYDPMYDYQIEKRGERVVFRGDKAAVSEYLAEAAGS
ncbi:tRNA 2-selenouridine(34) synthase MnmH [Hydrogenimonas sp.]